MATSFLRARPETSARFVSGCPSSTGRARHSVRADFVKAKRRAEGLPAYQSATGRLRLFQLTLSFFRKVQMLLNHFCCIISELLQVGIGSAACFLFEFSQVLFVVLDHRIHVGLV